MDRDVQPGDDALEPAADPVAELMEVARRVTEPWLRRVVGDAARRGGADPSGWPDLDPMIADTADELLERLARLLATDVDEQRTNPLSIYRDAVRAPSEFLATRGVVEPPGDAFAAARFPGDPYLLGPAGWDDIDPDLRVPGLTWGAWKAMTVLRRRRDEGRR